MDGLFTVFGLGTAFGVFCSWLYDVIRKRNLPVSRGASFEEFHGGDVMPAPEPLVSNRSSESALQADKELGSLVKAELSLSKGPLNVLDSEKRLSPIERSSSVAPVVVQPNLKTAVVFVTNTTEKKPAVVLPQEPVVMAGKKEPISTVKQKTFPAAPDEVRTFGTTQPLDIKSIGAQAPDTAGKDVVFTQTDTSDLDVDFDAHVSFADTVSFEPSDTEFSIKPRLLRIPGVPRVVLLVNNAVVRDVQENDLPGLMKEFGILVDSEEAHLFQGGNAVTIGRTNIQLAQV